MNSNYDFRFWREPDGPYKLQIKDMIFTLSAGEVMLIYTDMKAVLNE